RATLVRLLPAIFAGLEPALAPGDLFAALPWLRRGRPRPAEEVVGEVLAARAEGLAGEGDDLSPGADPELPAVTLRDDAPPAEPLVLRLPAAALPSPVLRLVESGEYLVPAARLPAPFALRLPARLDSAEALRYPPTPA